MRIISQDGKRDFNYENIDLNIVKSGVEEVSILCNTPCLLNVKMAQYSTREKAEKAINQLRVYCINECLIWQFPRDDEINMSTILPEGFENFEKIAGDEGRSVTAHEILGIISRAIEDDTDWGCVALEIIRYCRKIREENEQKIS